MQNTIPKTVRENIARAKGYLHRNELPRALEAMSSALREGGDATLFKQARFEMEIHFEEFLHDFIHHPTMQSLLDPHNTGKPRTIPYQRGKEALLATVLDGLRKILVESESQRMHQAEENEEKRKNELIQTGVARMAEGDISRGRAFLKRAAAEFGNQPAVLLTVGQHLADGEQYMDAADLFEKIMESNPKIAEAYSGAVDAYMNAREFSKAEVVFQKILRQFGGHPRTFGKMAQLYLAWQKRAKAAEFAQRALQVDAQQPEALAVMEKVGRT